jgi:nucleoside-diphosphate-sugar epimerase
MILLTGGLGFLGCNLAHFLARKGEKLILTRHRVSRIPSFLQVFVEDRITISPCDLQDIGDLLSVLENHPVKSIIHAVALYSPGTNLIQILRANILSTFNLLESCRIKKIWKILFISSHSVYERSHTIHSEDETLSLDSPHTISLTKKMCELACSYYAKEYGLNVTIVRPSQIYGPLYSSGRNPLQRMVENSTAGKPAELPEVNPLDGNNHIYVKDCARGIGLVQLADKPQFNIYNIGDAYVTYGEIAETIRKILPNAEIHLGAERREKATKPMYLDTKRVEKEFGFKIEFDLERGMRDYMRWLTSGNYENE